MEQYYVSIITLSFKVTGMTGFDLLEESGTMDCILILCTLSEAALLAALN